MSMNNKNPKGKTSLSPGGPSRTKQSFAVEADINNIIARYLKTGMAPVTDASRGSFADVSNIGSYAEVLQKVTAAQAGFRRLPSRLRTRFGNDPVRLLEFLGDPENREEAIKLGLVKAPPKKVPVAAIPAGSPPPTGKEVITPKKA